jgi:probable F420-dependent oxidoreductase
VGDVGVVFLGGDITTVVSGTRRAEAAGLSSAWTTEFYERSAMVSLAAMAQATERISIGSAIAYGVGRSPLVLAAEARDLDELSGGRLILGLGTGTRRMMTDWHGVDAAAPARRVEELVPLLRRFWRLDEEPIDHEGVFYRVRLRPTGDFRVPLRRDIPIFLAGVNPRMVEAAGAVADGLVGHPLFTARYVEEVVRPALLAGAGRAGRDRPVGIAGYVLCSVHDDASIARDEVRGQIAFYAVVRTYRRIMALHGWEDAAAELRRAWERRDRAGMLAAVTDDMVDTIAVAGTPDEVRQRLMEGAARHYDHVLLYAPSFGLPQARLAENVDALVDTFAAH